MGQSVLVTGGAISIGFSATSYLVVGNASAFTNTTETRMTCFYRTPGTLSNLYCFLFANTLNTALTIRTRVNSGAGFANGNQILSIGASTTGEFEDTTNTDAVVAGYAYTYIITNSAVSGGANTLGIRCLYTTTATGDTCTRFANISNPTLAPSTTYYRSLSDGISAPTTSTVESKAQYQIGHDGTLKNAYIYVLSNTVTLATTLRSRISGAYGNIIISVPKSTTGSFEDLTNTDDVTLYALVCFENLTGSTGTSFRCYSTAVDFITTSGSNAAVDSFVTGTAYSATRYFVIGGYLDATSIESQTRNNMLYATTADYLAVCVSASSTGSSNTFDLRKNGASSALTISIPSSTTGWFQDVGTHTVSIAATDEINYRFLFAGLGALTFTSMGMEMFVTPPAPPAGPAIVGYMAHAGL